MRFLVNPNDSGHFQVLVTGDGPKGEGADDCLFGANAKVIKGKGKDDDWFENFILRPIENKYELSDSERAELLALKP